MQEEENKKSKVKLEKMIQKSLLSKENKDLRLKWQKELAEKHGVKKNKGFSNFFLLALALIFSLLAIFFYVKYSQADDSSSPEKQANKYIAQMEVMSNPDYSTRGETMAINQSLLEAYEEVQNGEYNSAIEKYQRVKLDQELSSVDMYYLIIAYLKMDENLAAIPLLEELAKEEKIYSDEAKWLLSLAYTKNKDFAKAQQILNEIVDNNKYKWKKAAELKQIIEKN